MKILSVAYYTIVENIRNKIFYVIIFFGFIMLAAAFLLSVLGGEQPVRVLLDFGLSAIEFFALITICFASATLILEEIESKSIYLILTRPVPRFYYLLGRYLGLLAAVYLGMLIMAFMHVAILYVKHWDFTFRYFTALIFSMEKIAVIGSLALFFSLFSSSAVSSISFTAFFWVLGHFSEEIKFLGKKATFLFTKIIATVIYYVSPNLQLFNIRDFWDVPQISSVWIYPAFVYGLLYSFVFILLSLLLLRHKEF